MSKAMKTSKTLGKGWWISLGIVMIVAFLAVLIFVKPATKTPEPIAQPTTSKTEKPAGGCDVPLGDTSSKPAMPKDLRWEAAKGLTWPVSDTYGPTQDKDGYGVCFARTPLGAALAMTSFYGLGNTTDPKKATEIFAIDSPGKTLALSKPSGKADGASDVGPMAFSGFSVDSFTPDEAQITLVFALAKSATGYFGLPSTLRWVNGDWKLKVLDDGSTFAGKPTSPVDGQFTSWGGSRGM